MRTIRLSKRSRDKLLHIEAPGCIINVTIGLSDSDGHEVVNVSINADGTRYAGHTPWWIDGETGKDFTGCRVVKET